MNKQKYDYTVIVEKTSSRPLFISDVWSYLMRGWKCQGGVTVNTDSEGVEWIYQAMIREIKK